MKTTKKSFKCTVYSTLPQCRVKVPSCKEGVRQNSLKAPLERYVSSKRLISLSLNLDSQTC